MNDNLKKDQIDNPAASQATNLEQDVLDTVDISDDTLEKEDKQTKEARKAAKKLAKKIQTPEERRRRRIKKYGIIAAALGLVFAVLMSVPLTRWAVLNSFGLRSTFIVEAVDEADKPLSGAVVRVGDQRELQTDAEGRAYFQATQFGKLKGVIQKAGYGDRTFEAVNDVQSKPPRERLKVIGIQLDIDIKDWLSGRPIRGAFASYGESKAESDDSGRASLVIPPTDKKKVEIKVGGAGYLERAVETETTTVSREVLLVPGQKNYFISKRDGKLDIFSSNLDGSDQRKLIEASGKEDESLTYFSIHRANKHAILITNRDGKVTSDRLIAGVYLVDLEAASLKKIDEGSDIQVVGWGDDAIVYTKSELSLGYDDPAFARLMTYNTQNGRHAEIANANYFQASAVAQNKVFYVIADAYRTIDNGAMTSYDLASGATRSYLEDRPITYIGRPGYNTLEMQDSSGASFELIVSQHRTRPIDRRPGSSVMIALNQSANQAAWSDKRDGQGVFILRSLGDSTERIVTQAPGLTNPIRFVSDHIAVVRVTTSVETADYVLDTSTGNMKKVVDVSNVLSGVAQFGL